MEKVETGVFKKGRCLIMVNHEAGRWHMSISCENGGHPTYEEIKDARYELLPDDIYMAQIFPPKAEFVNVMPNVYHLWEINEKKFG